MRAAKRALKSPKEVDRLLREYTSRSVKATHAQAIRMIEEAARYAASRGDVVSGWVGIWS